MKLGPSKDPRKEFGAAISALAEQDERIVLLSADSGNSSGFKDFAKDHPERYFEFGIMEQGITGMAAGMATVGLIPVFCAIAPFVSCRNYEMFRNDLGYMRQNVKIVGRNGGMTYSDLGSTHHSLEDFAIMRMVPGAVVLCPQSPLEIRAAAKAMIKHVGPVYMRIGNPPVPEFFEQEPEFVIGKATILHEGSDLAIITTGSATADVLMAVEEAEKQGIRIRVIGMPTVCPIDEQAVLAAAKDIGRILTVEEHYVHGGLGTMVAEVCSENCPVPIKMCGVPREYAPTGSYDELKTLYKLDAPGILESILSFVSN